MKKQLLKERFQQLAGIKPLYTEQLGPRMSNPRPTGPSDDKALSDQSNEWLEDQVNMYFEGGDEPGIPGEQGEFEITRIEQGDPQKYDDAHLAQKFLEELRELRNIVVRYDDYIGDIKVTLDREGSGDAIVTWIWPDKIDRLR